jgi:hypothetical protein
MSIENMTAREFLAALRDESLRTDGVALLIFDRGDTVEVYLSSPARRGISLDSPTLIADLLGRTDGAT